MRPIPTASPRVISWKTPSSASMHSRMSSTFATSALLMSSNCRLHLGYDDVGRASRMERGSRGSHLFGLDVGGFDHFPPLLGLVDDEAVEIRRRAGEDRAAQIREA